MGLISLLNLKGKDVVAFVLCSIVGYFLASLLPPGAMAIYTSILVSYHLFLAWLVIDHDHKAGISLPIASTLLTHGACVFLVVLYAMGRHYIPFFGVLRYSVVGLAIFERNWLFSAPTTVSQPKVEPKPKPVVDSTGDDYQAWLNLLAARKPDMRRPGASLQAEYEQFVQARARNRVAAASHKSTA